MLAERRCGERLRTRRATEVDRALEAAISADDRVLVARDKLLRRDLRVVEHGFDTADSGAGNLLAEQRFPFERGACLQRLVQQRHDLGLVLRAFADRVVALRGALRQPRLRTERRPQVWRARAGGD